MILTPKNIAAFCLAGFLTLTSLQAGDSHGKGFDLLEERVKALTIKQPNINLALSAIAREYRIPIGIEMAAKGKEPQDKEIDIALTNKTLRDVLNAIVERDSRYTWKVTDGVINVYPRAGRDEVLKDLLETKVRSLSISNNPSLYRIRSSIVELPEIKSKLERAKLTPLIVGISGLDFERIGEEFSLKASDITLQEILNQIIRQSEVKFWILNRYGENNELLIINF